MLGLPGRIIDAIMNGPENQAPAALSLAGLSPVDGRICIQERAFQFWPETITEEPEIGWQFKEIPGLAHPLAQWTQNGGRSFTFEVPLSRFMRPWGEGLSPSKLLSLGLNKPDAKVPIDNRPMNISVKEQIQWLRQFYLPNYVSQDVSGIMATVSQPPPIAMLCMPSMGINENGGDVIWAVMTQCSVSYILLFPSGEPRLATVNLGFKQIIQDPVNGIVLKSRDLYNTDITKESNIAKAGGRIGKMDGKVTPP